jgi:hypothetical protein
MRAFIVARPWPSPRRHPSESGVQTFLSLPPDALDAFYGLFHLVAGRKAQQQRQDGRPTPAASRISLRCRENNERTRNLPHMTVTHPRLDRLRKACGLRHKSPVPALSSAYDIRPILIRSRCSLSPSSPSFPSRSPSRSRTASRPASPRASPTPAAAACTSPSRRARPSVPSDPPPPQHRHDVPLHAAGVPQQRHALHHQRLRRVRRCDRPVALHGALRGLRLERGRLQHRLLRGILNRARRQRECLGHWERFRRCVVGCERRVRHRQERRVERRRRCVVW